MFWSPKKKCECIEKVEAQYKRFERTYLRLTEEYVQLKYSHDALRALLQIPQVEESLNAISLKLKVHDEEMEKIREMLLTYRKRQTALEEKIERLFYPELHDLKHLEKVSKWALSESKKRIKERPTQDEKECWDIVDNEKQVITKEELADVLEQKRS